ncbi:MAG: hypothetical protein P9M08_02010 [Candidatus Erginobacter occultus]|nr:hypothetical protein [Candidatus Erginobacter occultus]
MTTRTATVILAAALAAALPGRVFPAGDPQPSAIADYVDILYPATPHRDAFRLRVRPDESAAELWPEDGFSLELWNDYSPPELQAALPFSSSYSDYNLWLADLTGDGREEFILVSGQGRGTCARSETLTVYSRDGAAFTALTDLPFSDYFGSGVRWYYEPTFVRDGDRFILELKLDWDDYSETYLFFPELIPGEKLIVIDLQ